LPTPLKRIIRKKPKNGRLLKVIRETPCQISPKKWRRDPFKTPIKFQTPFLRKEETFKNPCQQQGRLNPFGK